MKKILYQGNVYWTYADEIKTMGLTERYFIGQLFSFPISRHKGRIVLTEDSIILDGDEQVVIPLAIINQLYLGFDDVFLAASVKNFGMFWRPLRINYGDDRVIYLIIDYNMIISNNNRFFHLLKDMLS